MVRRVVFQLSNDTTINVETPYTLTEPETKGNRKEKHSRRTNTKKKIQLRS
jgi:hypothetical protein